MLQPRGLPPRRASPIRPVHWVEVGCLIACRPPAAHERGESVALLLREEGVWCQGLDNHQRCFSGIAEFHPQPVERLPDRWADGLGLPGHGPVGVVVVRGSSGRTVMVGIPDDTMPSWSMDTGYGLSKSRPPEIPPQ